MRAKSKSQTLHCRLCIPWCIVIIGVKRAIGDNGSRLVDTKKRDQLGREGNKKLATRALLLGAGLSEERQTRELVSGTLAEHRQESWPSREILHAGDYRPAPKNSTKPRDPSASLAIPKQAKTRVHHILCHSATELNPLVLRKLVVLVACMDQVGFRFASQDLYGQKSSNALLLPCSSFALVFCPKVC
jgi:hypothetical protein